MDKQSRRGKHNRSKALRDKNRKYAKNKSKKPGCEEESSEEELDNSKKTPEEPKAEAKVEECSISLTTATDTKKVAIPKRAADFNRRKVTSNWERYEEPHIEHYGDMMRGADYSEILNTNSGGSFFRFKDEQVMDKELSLFNKAEEFFSIDIDDLTRALLCVPLHVRLMIDRKAFPKKILSKMEAAAHKNSLSYTPPERIDPVKASAQKQTVEKINRGIVDVLLGQSNDEIEHIRANNDKSFQGSEPVAQFEDQGESAVDEIDEPMRLSVKDSCTENGKVIDKSDLNTVDELEDLNVLLNLGRDDLSPPILETSPSTTPIEMEPEQLPLEQKTIKLVTENDDGNLEEDWLDAVLDAA